MSDTAMKVCAGPCGRELPEDETHFYRQQPRGFAPRCRDCVKAEQAEKRAAKRERRAADPPRPKRCIGPCGRELPSDSEHFARDTMNRPRPRCRQCELGADMAAAIENGEATKRCRGRCGQVLPADTAHFYRKAGTRDGLQARCKTCTNADQRERAAGLAPGPAPRPPVRRKDAPAPLGLSDPGSPARLDMIRRAVDVAPEGHKAEAAERVRRIMRRADAAVEAACAPPFDAADVLLMMAEDAEDVDTLGRSLRTAGWTPTGP
jgi:hypothetical protein